MAKAQTSPDLGSYRPDPAFMDLFERKPAALSEALHEWLQIANDALAECTSWAEKPERSWPPPQRYFEPIPWQFTELIVLWCDTHHNIDPSPLTTLTEHLWTLQSPTRRVHDPTRPGHRRIETVIQPSAEVIEAARRDCAIIIGRMISMALDRRSRRMKTAQVNADTWKPPEGYVKATAVVSSDGELVPRTTVSSWAERHPPGDGEVLTDPRSGALYYRQDWIDQRRQGHRRR